MRLFIISTLFLFCAIRSIPAQDAAEQAFSSSLSAALKSQDKNALYSITSFDKMDDTWKAKVKASLDKHFNELVSAQDIVVTISPVDSSTLKPIKYKDDLLFYNLPIVSQAEVTFPNSEQLKNQTTTFYLGKKDGKFFISSLCPQNKR